MHLAARLIRPRIHPLAKLLVALLALAHLALSAQTIMWIGDGDTNDITEPDNWSAPPVGDGTDDAEFGDVDPASSTIYVPGAVELHELTFTNTAATSYYFHGDSPSLLLLKGDIATAAGSQVHFADSIQIYLSTGVHVADIGSGSTVIVESNIGEESSTASIQKTGIGSLVLAGDSTFAGGVAVAGGTLVIGADSVYDEVLQSSPVGLGLLSLANGTTLTSYEEYDFNLYNDIALDSGGGTVTMLSPQYGSLYLWGTISGSAYLDVWGEGTLILDNPLSTFPGISLHEGTLLLGTSSTDDGSIAGPLGSSWVKLYGGSTLGLVEPGAGTANRIIHNPITLDCNDGATAMVNVNSPHSLELAGIISGEARFEKLGTGSLILSGDNTFTGGLIMTGGGVTLEHDHATGNGLLSFGDYTSANFLTASPVVHGLSAPSPYHTITLADSSTLTIFQTEDASVHGGISGTGAFVIKEGAATLTFTGPNTYTGGTVINDGTLVAADSGALSSGAVTVNSGTLQLGNYSLGNTITVNGGTLVLADSDVYDLALISGRIAGTGFVVTATFGGGRTLAPGINAGAGAGTMEFGHIELASGGTMEWNIRNPTGVAGTDWDRVNSYTSSTVDITATSANRFTLKLISLDAAGDPGALSGFDFGQSYHWLMFDSDNLQGFSADKFTLNLDNFFVDLNGGTLSLGQVGHQMYLDFTPVPEPETFALLLLGLLPVAYRWRRQRS